MTAKTEFTWRGLHISYTPPHGRPVLHVDPDEGTTVVGLLNVLGVEGAAIEGCVLFHDPTLPVGTIKAAALEWWSHRGRIRPGGRIAMRLRSVLRNRRSEVRILSGAFRFLHLLAWIRSVGARIRPKITASLSKPRTLSHNVAAPSWSHLGRIEPVVAHFSGGPLDGCSRVIGDYLIYVLHELPPAVAGGLRWGSVDAIAASEVRYFRRRRMRWLGRQRHYRYVFVEAAPR